MADDDELDELLDSALSDFDKPATPSAKKVITQRQNQDDQKVAETNTTESHVHDEKEPNEDELSKIFAESFAEAAADLEEAMKKMGGAQDADFMANLNQLASSAQQAASKEHPEAMNAFEENLAKTMNEMAQNAKDLENPDAFGDDLVKAMSAMGLDGNDDGLDMMPLMQGMMKNLLSKEILYPSLNELNDKYPAWLEEHKSSHSTEEHDRLTKQHQLVGQLCQEYENEQDGDSEEIQKKRLETIMNLMQKMQECGQPPEELVGSMIPGVSFGEGVMPNMPVDMQNECKVS